MSKNLIFTQSASYFSILAYQNVPKIVQITLKGSYINIIENPVYLINIGFSSKKKKTILSKKIFMYDCKSHSLIGTSQYLIKVLNVVYIHLFP